MRPLSIILIFFASILLPQVARCQEIIGKWKGYFSPNNTTGFKVFTYEVSFTPSNAETIAVTTLSKLNNEFSAKAYGIGSISGPMVQFQETRFDIIKLGNTSQGCLMTCYLNYKNIRGLDVLEGTYTSQSVNGAKDCGGGTIYLQKNQSIEKTIADLTSKHKTIHPNNATASSQKAKPTNNAKTATQNTGDVSTSNINKQINKETAINNLNPSIIAHPTNAVSNTNLNNIIIAPEKTTQINTIAINKINTNNTDPGTSKMDDDNIVDNIPWVLVGRENKLVKQINTSSKQFTIDLYDNGTIDNDTINVYDNKRLLANLKRLSDKPIHLDFNFTEKTKQHEVIITAHNMGLVPPNTALLVLKENGNRQELFITTTNTFNAKIIIQYTPPN